ncbi:MAG: hypothetical protein HKN91_10805 [Acidimicrobiia bacterium]|nr:hypothetical protein [Acidimicrobiia bacterium]
MEAPKGRGRITPLPPPEPDGMGRPVERAPRQWLPMVVALTGLVAFALWLAGSGAPVSNEAAAGNGQSTLAPLSAADPAPATSIIVASTTTTNPPTLGEMLLGLEGSLVIFSGDASGDFMSVWNPSLPAPQEFRLSSSNVTRIEPEPATMSFIAYETAGRVTSLHLGGWQTQEPIFVGSRGFAWDPTGSATLLFVGIDRLTGETSLYRHGVTEPLERVAPLPDGSRLIGWAEPGLILAVDLAPAVNVVHPDTGAISIKNPTITEFRTPQGELIGSATAEPLRVAPAGTIVAMGSADALEAAAVESDVESLDVPNTFVVLGAADTLTLRAVPFPEVLGDGELIFSPDGRWSLSDDGERVARTTNTGVATAIATRSLVTQGIRSLSLQSGGEKSTVGFSQNGEWFFSYSNDDEQLFAATSTGAQFAVPFERNIRLEGVYIRP